MLRPELRGLIYIYEYSNHSGAYYTLELNCENPPKNTWH